MFLFVKLAGALYLVFLGVQAVRHRHSLAAAMSSAAGPGDGWRALRDGFIVGVTNPKSFILFGAILPQFVDRAGNVPAQMLLLALISVSMGLVSDVTWGLAASTVRAWFARSRAFLGTALVLAEAARLAWRWSASGSPSALTGPKQVTSRRSRR